MADGNFVNSAGSLMAAIMETLGYHYQAHLLDSLSDPLTNEVGGLLYLFGIALAVIMTATQGKYKMGVWLLIGPPLFFATIIPTGDIEPASWQFGRQERDNEAVEKGAEEAQEENGTAFDRTPNVSKLFRAYVKLIAVVSQEMVHTISKSRKDADLWFVTRAELFAQMHTPQFDNPSVRRLFQKAMLGDCGTALKYARGMHDPLYRATQFSNAEFEAIKLDPDAQDAQRFFKNRQSVFEQAFNQKAGAADSSVAIIDLNLDNLSAEVVATRELGAGASAKEVHDRIEEVIKRRYTCHQVWELVLFFIEKQTEKELATIVGDAEARGVDPGKVQEVLKQAYGYEGNVALVHDREAGTDAEFSATDALKIKRVMAKFLLRNEMKIRSQGAWMSHWVTGLETRDLQLRYTGKESFTEYARVAAQEWSERERLISAAASVPYYQGLALYALGATFPFFALVLLIPGKHSAFILWFILWGWIKSWDVGMAIVMLLDDTFFAIFAVKEQALGAVQGTEGELERFDLALSSIQEMDPTFQMSTYYTLAATSMLAVPPVTAQLIMGSLKGGASLISAGIQRSALQASSPMLGAVEQATISAIANDKNDARNSYMRKVEANRMKGLPTTQGMTDNQGRPIGRTGNSVVKNTVAPTPQAGQAREQRFLAVGAGNGYSVTGKESFGQRNLDILARSKRAGQAQGASAPLTMFGSQANTHLDAATTAYYTEAKNMDQVYADQGIKIEGKYFSESQAGAMWDLEGSDEQMYRTNLMSVMGALAIPAPNFLLSYAGAEEAEARIFQEAEAEYLKKKAEWAIKEDLLKTVLKVANVQLAKDKLNPVTDFAAIRGLAPDVQRRIMGSYSNATGGLLGKGRSAFGGAVLGLFGEGVYDSFKENPEVEGVLTGDELVRARGELASGEGFKAHDRMLRRAAYRAKLIRIASDALPTTVEELEDKAVYDRFRKALKEYEELEEEKRSSRDQLRLIEMMSGFKESVRIQIANTFAAGAPNDMAEKIDYKSVLSGSGLSVVNQRTLSNISRSIYGDIRVPDYQASGLVPQGFSNPEERLNEQRALARIARGGAGYFGTE